jgi:glycerol kinase
MPSVTGHPASAPSTCCVTSVAVHVIAIDAGTTSVRAIAFDSSGRIVASSGREFTQHFPEPGRVEHDANEILAATMAVLGEVHQAMGTPPAAIGITDQRETVVVWDRRTGEPLARAIVWQDRRTAPRCDALAAAGHLPLVRATTGLVLDPYFSATKLEWLFTEGGLTAGPEVAVGTIDSWLLWHLTGGAVHATDVTNASRTLLFDITQLAWSAELCDLFGVPLHVLPEVRPSSGRLGVTTANSPVGAGVPISGIAGDQQAALFGQACFAPGMTKNTYGTGSFVLMNVGTTCPPPVDGLLTTVAWTLPSADGSPSGAGGPVTTYAYEGAIFVTGAAVQWLRDGLEIIDDAAETGALAASVPDAGGVVIVPAFTGLGSPWWDPYARGAVLGITRGTTRAHLARAVVESMAHATRDVVDAMVDACGHDVTALRADGGASAMDLLLQIQADQLGVQVARPKVRETTALGAAYLAGLAEGVWGSLDDITANWALDVTAEPATDELSRALVDASHQVWLRAVGRARHWVVD